MSFFEDASLVLIPSAQKTSKVYSVKPTDGTGDLTFTRSNDTATRVGPDGLIEKVRTNLQTYSEDFTNAVYIKSECTASANTTTAPNGTLTADTITENTSNNVHRIQTSDVSVVAGTPYTLSVYAKNNGRRYLYLNANTAFGARTAFDLQLGVIAQTISGSAQIESLPNGWYRCSVSGTAAATQTTVWFAQLNNAGVATDTVYTGDGTSGLFFWGSQLETTDFGATLYIPTTTAAVSVGPVANVPRLDYLNSSCPRLILEGQRTNLATFSEQANQYTKAGATIGSNVVTSPDGYTNADSLIEDGSNGAHAFFNFGLTTFTAAAYTASVFAKKGSRDWFALQIYHSSSHVAYFNLNTGVVGTVEAGATATITNYGNGWYRCTITTTTTVNAGGIAIYGANADNSISYAGTNGLTAGYFYGWQLELGAYATSYIPTLGAAVTRGADTCSKTGISSLIGQTEGTIFFECSNKALLVGARYFGVSDGSGSNRIDIYQADATNLGIFVGAGGAAQVNVTNVALPASGAFKFALAYANNDYVWYVNGTQVSTDTSASVPATSVALLGAASDLTASGGNSPFSQALLFKTRLSNADLAALTA